MLGGTAAVIAGGAALAMTPQVRNLFGDDAAKAGDATGTKVTDGNAARPTASSPARCAPTPSRTRATWAPGPVTR